jgi:hypothetical protein
MPTPYQSLVIADGAVSYVPGNDTVSPVVDIIQNVTDSDSIQHPTLGLPAPLLLGGTGLGFYRSGGAMGMEFPNPFAAPGTGALSLELWVNSTDTLPATGSGTTCPASGMCSDVSGFGHTDWGLGFTGAMKPSFSLGLPGTGNDATLTAATTLNDGNWHYVAVTWDAGTGTAIIYVDAVNVAQSTAFTAASTNGFGFWNAGIQVTESFIGTANNFALYGVALSPAQVLAHYTAGVATQVPDVTGETVTQAETDIVAAGFTVGTVTGVPGSPPGIVVSQSPSGLQPVGTAIDLIVTQAGVIPNFFDDELMFGAYFGGVLNLVEFVYLPEREPFLASPSPMIINRYLQEPTDNRQRGVDYHFFLVPGETIQTLAVTGISAQGVLQVDTNPLVTPLVITNLLLDPSGTKFAYNVSGGQDGIEYEVQFTTTTQIQTSTVEEIFSIRILVQDQFP